MKMICRVAFISVLLAVAASLPTDYESDIELRNTFTLFTKAQWGGRAATGSTALRTPVPNVIIHHSVTAACTTNAACSTNMRSMQNHHMNVNGWADIGYNFAVGGDGAVYEGRGWRNVGAHATNFNSNSIGIVLIGTWSSATPPRNQLDTAQRLIAQGVSQGFIASNYALRGHRQVGSTECPGNALFNEISRWPRFQRSAQMEEISMADE